MAFVQAFASAVLLLVLMASVPMAVIFEIRDRAATKRERRLQESFGSAVARIDAIAEATKRQMRLLARRL